MLLMNFELTCRAGEGGMNWEIMIDIYTLSCVKLIASGNLLHSRELSSAGTTSSFMQPFSVPWASWFGSGSTTGRNVVRDPRRCCKVSSDLTDLPFLTLLPWNRPRNTHVKGALPTPREKEHPSPWRQGKLRSILTGLAKFPPVSCNYLIFLNLSDSSSALHLTKP